MEKGQRFNEGKPKWSLVHFGSLLGMVRVLMFGARKYAPDNWKKEMDMKELLESAMRHLTAAIDGEELDAETGETHISHMMCNGMFWQYHYEKQQNKKKKK
jgi:hypothetical protein